MHKLVSISAMAAALSLAAAPSHAEGHFYLNGALGKSKNDANGYKAPKGTKRQGSTSGTSSRLMAGYRWNILPKLAIGPEVGYANLGRLSPSVRVQKVPSAPDTKRNINTVTFGINTKWNITEHLYAMGKIGRASTNQLSFPKEPDSIEPGKKKTRGGGNVVGSYWGIGLGYDINSHWGVGIGHDGYTFSRSRKGVTKRLDVTATTATIEYRF